VHGRRSDSVVVAFVEPAQMVTQVVTQKVTQW